MDEISEDDSMDGFFLFFFIENLTCLRGICIISAE